MIINQSLIKQQLTDLLHATIYICKNFGSKITDFSLSSYSTRLKIKPVYNIPSQNSLQKNNSKNLWYITIVSIPDNYIFDRVLDMDEPDVLDFIIDKQLRLEKIENIPNIEKSIFELSNLLEVIKNPCCESLQRRILNMNLRWDCEQDKRCWSWFRDSDNTSTHIELCDCQKELPNIHLMNTLCEFFSHENRFTSILSR